MSTASPLEPRAPRAASTALEDPRTRQLDPVLARLVLAGRISADAAVRATATAQEQRQSLAAAVTSLGPDHQPRLGRGGGQPLRFRAGGGRRAAARAAARRPGLAALPAPRGGAAGARRPTTRSGWPWPIRATPTPIKAVGLATGASVVPVIAALEDLQQAYARYWDAGQSALQRIVDDIGEDLTGELSADVEHLIGAAQEAPVVRLVNQLLTDALRLHASRHPHRARAATSCACATASTAGCARPARRRPGCRRR